MIALAPDEAAVCVGFTDGMSDETLSRYARVLSDDELARRDRFVFADDRRDFTAAHGLIREVLSQYANMPPHAWEFEVDLLGKPSIAHEQAGEPPLSFNLSHTAGVVACVIARGAHIGIDVERCDRRTDALPLAARYFAPSELRLLTECCAADVATRFIELWTLKECYLKAVGCGLSLPLASFAFSFDGPSGLSFASQSDARAWQFRLAAVGQAVRLAVAVARPGGGGSRIQFAHLAGAEPRPSVTLLRLS